MIRKFLDWIGYTEAYRATKIYKKYMPTSCHCDDLIAPTPATRIDEKLAKWRV